MRPKILYLSSLLVTCHQSSGLYGVNNVFMHKGQDQVNIVEVYMFTIDSGVRGSEKKLDIVCQI